ncbi:DUF2065 domain-containing protein [Aliikangiella coralliicola]|uniref:DUF2065 domain-containing protein n=1 Tax=Aliikangiella coralliicola TaxID=2592383 RepID=A0A545UBW9_9GAMM|nr:DUF2065 domain-containing protein [Aliikangiella coralliicola]TQV86958.1 DUF2065 domain-containing protein [Aliikangiella coralliicola]
MSDLWAAIAIALILEGMMPFLSPRVWKETLTKFLRLPDERVRGFGFIAMLGGVLLLFLVR